jgi:amino acid transporter
VNFGAMTAFLVLHVSVVVHYVIRQGSRRWFRHLVFPVLGFVVLAYVVINAQVAAQLLGFVWLAVGVVVLMVSVLTGRRPRLTSEAPETPRAAVTTETEESR